MTSFIDFCSCVRAIIPNFAIDFLDDPGVGQRSFDNKAFISDKNEKDFESNEHGAGVSAPDCDGSKDRPHRDGGAAGIGVGSEGHQGLRGGAHGAEPRGVSET